VNVTLVSEPIISNICGRINVYENVALVSEANCVECLKVEQCLCVRSSELCRDEFSRKSQYPHAANCNRFG
jgi:hypothetical protein